MDNFEDLFDFDFDTEDCISPVQNVHYQMEWVTKNGCRRALQYWVYCESNHDNYLKLDLQVPGLKITSSSRIMSDCFGQLYIVEDINSRNEFKTVFPLFSSSSSISFMSLQFLQPVDESGLAINICLIADDELPQHPFQEETKFVKSIFKISKESDTRFPFSSTVSTNFQGRGEGWFKIQVNLMYKQTLLLASSISEPFMFNNPRLKKMKEQRNYTPKEIKFMQLAESYGNKEQYFNQYGYLYKNAKELLENASTLFPNIKAATRKKSKQSLVKNVVIIL